MGQQHTPVISRNTERIHFSNFVFISPPLQPPLYTDPGNGFHGHGSTIPRNNLFNHFNSTVKFIIVKMRLSSNKIVVPSRPGVADGPPLAQSGGGRRVVRPHVPPVRPPPPPTPGSTNADGARQCEAMRDNTAITPMRQSGHKNDATFRFMLKNENLVFLWAWREANYHDEDFNPWYFFSATLRAFFPLPPRMAELPIPNLGIELKVPVCRPTSFDVWLIPHHGSEKKMQKITVECIRQWNGCSIYCQWKHQKTEQFISTSPEKKWSKKISFEAERRHLHHPS